jgi:DNA-binding NarL/FixJ family response regulator
MRSILIVDDHAGFRSMARDLLEAAGFAVVGEAGDGRRALEMAGEARPDIVLLDVQLPDIDGFTVARGLLVGALPPVIVLISTRDAGDYGPRIGASGAAGFILKAELSGDTLRAALAASEEVGA